MRTFALLVCACVGCSREPIYIDEPPAKLAQQVAEADRVVVTNTFPSSSAVLSAAEAQKVIWAVAHSKKVRVPEYAAAACVGGSYLQFLRGTNLLAQVEGHADHFHDFGYYYVDESGEVAAAFKKVNR